MRVISFVSNLISSQLLTILNELGDVVLIPKLNKTYHAISTHADIQIAIINNQLFIDSDSWNNINSYGLNKEQLKTLKPTVITTKLGNRYPLSVPFNGKFLDNTWIHHLTFTDKTILEYLYTRDIRLIQTNQGYTGCSLLLLPNRKGITSDIGLANSLDQEGYDILIIDEGYINLEGMSHGFIGGCCGLIDKVVYINGDLDRHPNGKRIREFIMNNNLEIQEVKDYPLTDIGSILFYKGEEHE